MTIRRFLRKVMSAIGVAITCVALIGGSSAWATTPMNVTIEPGHEEKCATILKVFCESAKDNGEGTIKDIIRFVISIFTAGICVLATIGIIICGYMIMTASGNDQKVAKAKSRLVEIVIGLVVWVIGSAIVLLLVPDSEAADYAKSGATINIERIK